MERISGARYPAGTPEQLNIQNPEPAKAISNSMSNLSPHKENSTASRNSEKRNWEICEHENSVCICNTSDAERAAFLREQLDVLDKEGWSNVQLMPLGEEGKGPIIEGRCRLDSSESKSLLVDGDEAVRLIRQEGARGFCLYAGKPKHGTGGLVFTDHDDPDRFPAEEDTLTVKSGSGEGYHQIFENAGDVRSAKGKQELESAGEVRSQNQYIICVGSIHPSGGIYHIESKAGIGKLESDDLPVQMLPSSETPTSEPPEINTEVPDSLGDIDADFSVESRYQTMLNCSSSETIEAIIKGNLAQTRYKDDRHQAEGYLAEQVGFYMGREREVIKQVLTKIFTRNPETDAHTNNPNKNSRRKFLQNDYHREQILDYATAKNSKYDPGLGITRYTREERPEVGYPLIDRVQDALADLILARKVEIVEHSRVDRGETQVYKALTKMLESDDVPFDVKSVTDGRKRYYYLGSHVLLIPENRRRELQIDLDI